MPTRAWIIERLIEISHDLKRLKDIPLARRSEVMRALHNERRKLMHYLALLPPTAEGLP
jgi:hypothetical protein